MSNTHNKLAVREDLLPLTTEKYWT